MLNLSTTLWRFSNLCGSRVPTRQLSIGQQNSALGQNFARYGFHALMHGKTNLFNQQEFLKGNEGKQAQDMAGSVVGYTLDHHQGRLLHSENVPCL